MRGKVILNLMKPDFARWRVWAADLRKGPFREEASLLCRLLDDYDDQSKSAQAGNLTHPLRCCIEMTIGRLLTRGAPPLQAAAVLWERR